MYLWQVHKAKNLVQKFKIFDVTNNYDDLISDGIEDQTIIQAVIGCLKDNIKWLEGKK